ncbi:MAG: hypothetical protein JST38_03275 [Bacteroidetes bacterium]|nr:hypothetical protein [Bacteroidota bacterium]
MSDNTKKSTSRIRQVSSMTLDPEVIRQVRAIAQEENRTVSNTVEYALKRFVAERKKAL